ncbi:hypothetical protein NMG60_11022218 [Bertholletia excelsa]
MPPGRCDRKQVATIRDAAEAALGRGGALPLVLTFKEKLTIRSMEETD